MVTETTALVKIVTMRVCISSVVILGTLLLIQPPEIQGGIYLPKRHVHFYFQQPKYISKDEDLGTVYTLKNDYVRCPASKTSIRIKSIDHQYSLSLSARLSRENDIVLSSDIARDKKVNEYNVFELQLECELSDMEFQYPDLWKTIVSFDFLSFKAYNGVEDSDSKMPWPPLWLPEVCSINHRTFHISYDVLENSKYGQMDQLVWFSTGLFTPEALPGGNGSQYIMLRNNSKLDLIHISPFDSENSATEISFQVKFYLPKPKNTSYKQLGPFNCPLTFTIYDVDDNAPILVPNPPTNPIKIEVDDIPENGKFSDTITVKDTDIGVVPAESYSITSNDTLKVFAIDSTFLKETRFTSISINVSVSDFKTMSFPYHIDLTIEDIWYRPPQGSNTGWNSNKLVIKYIFVKSGSAFEIGRAENISTNKIETILDIFATKYSLITQLPMNTTTLAGEKHQWVVKFTQPPFYNGKIGVTNGGQVYLKSETALKRAVIGPITGISHLIDGEHVEDYEIISRLVDSGTGEHTSCLQTKSCHFNPKLVCESKCGIGSARGRCFWNGACSPDPKTCPDGVCSALESLDINICPQDCIPDGTCESIETDADFDKLDERYAKYCFRKWMERKTLKAKRLEAMSTVFECLTKYKEFPPPQLSQRMKKQLGCWSWNNTWTNEKSSAYDFWTCMKQADKSVLPIGTRAFYDSYMTSDLLKNAATTISPHTSPSSRPPISTTATTATTTVTTTAATTTATIATATTTTTPQMTTMSEEDYAWRHCNIDADIEITSCSLFKKYFIDECWGKFQGPTIGPMMKHIKEILFEYLPKCEEETERSVTTCWHEYYHSSLQTCRAAYLLHGCLENATVAPPRPTFYMVVVNPDEVVSHNSAIAGCSGLDKVRGFCDVNMNQTEANNIPCSLINPCLNLLRQTPTITSYTHWLAEKRDIECVQIEKIKSIFRDNILDLKIDYLYTNEDPGFSRMQEYRQILWNMFYNMRSSQLPPFWQILRRRYLLDPAYRDSTVTHYIEIKCNFVEDDICKNLFTSDECLEYTPIRFNRSHHAYISRFRFLERHIHLCKECESLFWRVKKTHGECLANSMYRACFKRAKKWSPEDVYVPDIVNHIFEETKYYAGCDNHKSDWGCRHLETTDPLECFDANGTYIKDRDYCASMGGSYTCDDCYFIKYKCGIMCALCDAKPDYNILTVEKIPDVPWYVTVSPPPHVYGKFENLDYLDD